MALHRSGQERGPTIVGGPRLPNRSLRGSPFSILRASIKAMDIDSEGPMADRFRIVVARQKPRRAISRADRARSHPVAGRGPGRGSDIDKAVNCRMGPAVQKNDGRTIGGGPASSVTGRFRTAGNRFCFQLGAKGRCSSRG